MKRPLMCFLLGLLITGLPGQDAGAQDDLAVSLGERVIEKTQVARELREFVSQRVPPLQLAADAAAWKRESNRLRREVLQQVLVLGNDDGQ